MIMTNSDSYSAADLDSAVDNFDVPDAPLHPDDTFDPHAYVDQLLKDEDEEENRFTSEGGN